MKKTNIAKFLILSLSALMCFTACKKDPVSSETPASSEQAPASSEQAPASSETPVSSEETPASSEEAPTSSEETPVSSEPVSSEPVSSEPESSEPVSSEPESSEPVSSEPESSEPTSSEPSSSEVEKTTYGTFENPLTPAEVAEICKDFENNQPSAEKGYVTGVIKDTPQENTKYSSWSFYLEAGDLQFQVYSAKLKSGLSAPKLGDTVVVYGYFTKYYEKYEVAYISSLSDSPEIQSIVAGSGSTTPEVPPVSSEPSSSEPESSEPAPVPGETVTAKKVLADCGWENSVLYPTLTIDSVVTAKSSGTPVGSYSLNTGKYYNTGKGWRFYQKEGAKCEISVPSGYELVSVKVTYTVDNTGVLTLNGSNVTSDSVVPASGTSITFGVGNTGSATNGQVRISAFEVVYQAA